MDLTVEEINENCDMGGCDDIGNCKKDGEKCVPLSYDSWSGLSCRHMT
jgi:hypothetical protein